MSGAEITVQLACDDRDVPGADTLRAWVELALAEAGADAGGCREVSLRIVDEDEALALNRQYRGQQRATNVLSFPAAAADAFDALDGDQARPLGDLVLCAPLVRREAAEQGKSPDQHWGHLVVHGTLHLLGYDHGNDAEARAMEALEIRILARRGVDNPYGNGIRHDR